MFTCLLVTDFRDIVHIGLSLHLIQYCLALYPTIYDATFYDGAFNYTFNE